MTFLNAILAFGAAAFSIPLIIHLLNRSRFRTVDWGAMHLLENVVRINRRRLQISQLLLLLLRCAIPVLLAFLMARPVLTGFQSMPGDAPESLVLVIDDSRSMAAGEIGQPTRMGRAKKELTEMLGDMSRRDEVMMVRATEIDAPAATMGPSDAIEQLSKMTAEGAPVDLGRLVEAGVNAAAEATHQQQRIIVVSDFQNRMLGSGAVKTLDQVAASFQEQDTSPLVSFWDFGRAVQELPNVSVDAVDVDSPAVVAGRTAQYSALIQNTGEIPANDLRVVWSINGRPLEPDTISVGPKSRETSRLNYVIDDPGVYEITVAIEHGDSLPADNRRTTSVHVMREINVLLVDGDPSREPLEGEVDFLAIALSPFAFGGDDQPDAVRAKSIGIGLVEKSLREQRPEMLVLANCRRIQGSTRSAITEFVLSGGSLIVFDGDQIQADAYNETWTSKAGKIRMPAVLGEVVGGDNDSDDSVGMRVGELNPNFVAWDLLRSGDSQPLPDVEVSAYRKLSVDDDTENNHDESAGDSGPGIVLLRMSSGDPLVVMGKRGQGQIVQFAISANHVWSNLPMRPLYLPMMQQLVLEMAGKGKRQTSDVGVPMVVPVSEFDAVARDRDDEDSKDGKSPTRTSYSVQLPGGDEVSVQPDRGDTPSLVWHRTQRPGTYRFRQKRLGEKRSDKSNDGAVTTLRIVDVPPSESRLQHLGTERLESAANTLDAKIYQQLSDIQADERTRRFGREIWRWLLVLLLVFLVSELLLQQRMAKPSSAKGVA